MKSRWIRIGEENVGPRAMYRCECGTERLVIRTNVERGKSVSCGCYNKELNGLRSGAKGRSSDYTYKSYSHMKYRCLNKGSGNWERYGGRGIKVCDRWIKSYDNFLEDMGERPKGTSIERIDVNGNYEPSNCKWATTKEQSLNKRSSKSFSFYGVSLVATEWEKLMEVPRGRILGRIQSGKDPFESIFLKSENKKREFGKYRLTQSNVVEIKELLQKGLTNTTIGDMFNVNRKTISDIKLNKTWKGV